jgi:hypothetical protein
MEKYAVKQDKDEGLEKTASRKHSCGGDIKQEGQTLICSNCGTKPWESK